MWRGWLWSGADGVLAGGVGRLVERDWGLDKGGCAGCVVVWGGGWGGWQPLGEVEGLAMTRRYHFKARLDKVVVVVVAHGTA